MSDTATTPFEAMSLDAQAARLALAIERLARAAEDEEIDEESLAEIDAMEAAVLAHADGYGWVLEALAESEVAADAVVREREHRLVQARRRRDAIRARADAIRARALAAVETLGRPLAGDHYQLRAQPGGWTVDRVSDDAAIPPGCERVKVEPDKGKIKEFLANSDAPGWALRRVISLRVKRIA